jgi:hypothetical protein
MQLRKQQAEAGDIVLLYGDESEGVQSALSVDRRTSSRRKTSPSAPDLTHRYFQPRGLRLFPWHGQPAFVECVHASFGSA